MSMHYGYAPRLMKAPEAARYVGVSETKLRTSSVKPKRWEGNLLYDRHDLDSYADRLAYEGEDECKEINPADAVFGLVAPTAA